MSKNETKWYKNNWTIGLVTSAILPTILSIIVDLFKFKQPLTTFGEIWNWLWNNIWYLLNYEVKIWWLLTLGIFYLIVKKTLKGFLKPKTEEPEFITYKRDKFIELPWEWDYKISNYVYEVVNLRPFCPECDTALYVEEGHYGYDASCPHDVNHLEKSIDPKEYEKIKIIIYDNIKKKKYLNKS